MVGNLAKKLSPMLIKISEMPHEDIKWCAVTLNDVIKAGKRLEASVFEIEGKHAREQVLKCKYGAVQLNDPENGLIEKAYYPGRFKRIYSDSVNGVPFYLPSQMTDVYPKAEKHISALTKCNISDLSLKKGNVLLTRSGTVGSVTLVSKTLENTVFSDDVIRVSVKNNVDIGYLYAFLRSKTGNKILQTNGYGSVITHIEPEHLSEIFVPNPPKRLKAKINDLIIKSFDLRDESNELIDKATKLLFEELHLPPISEFDTHKFDRANEVDNFTVKLSELSGRLEGSYHVPIVRAIVEHLEKYANEVTNVGDNRVSKEIILPGRFKRVYVAEGQGVVFFSGKNIMELDPSDKKYLSFAQHESRIREQLTIKQNMLLITCSGTVGRVAFVPQHWDNWAMTHDIIRLVPNKDIMGYLFVWLSSVYANKLLEAKSYGSVVQHIEKVHLNGIAVPLLRNKALQDEINNLALKANELRYEAYLAEQKALQIMDDEVIFAE